MKIQTSIMTLVVALTMVGCSKSDDSTAPDKTVTGQDLKDKYKDALKTTGDYASQTKDQFMATMDQKMKELDVKIQHLSDKSADYKDAAKADSDKALADLHEQRIALGKKYDELKASSQDAWDKTKAGFVSAWESVTNAYENTKAKITK